MRVNKIIILLIFGLLSCDSNQPTGNEIVFVDVIGSYDGECADYINSTLELMNREEATLTVFAASANTAGVQTSCERIIDQNLPLKSASASSIIFERVQSDVKVTMTYISEYDSITIIQTQEGKNENLIFTGKRS